ncbi:hypothetical protein [Sporosarcina sp. SG10008]|uniref:hypothetical protein n=1 Tax=Sporosarcina TaxID=1569 RepID=UPI0037DCA2FD
MSEKKQQDLKKENDTGFTGMPEGKPYPDFEPKTSEKQQVEQFKDSAENGKKDK